MSSRRGRELPFEMASKSKRMFVPMMKVKGMIISNLEFCQAVGSKFVCIQKSNWCRNGLLQVELYKVTQIMYKIRHGEAGATFFKIDSSEGIGSPAKAALTFICLKKSVKRHN